MAHCCRGSLPERHDCGVSRRVSHSHCGSALFRLQPLSPQTLLRACPNTPSVVMHVHLARSPRYEILK